MGSATAEVIPAVIRPSTDIMDFGEDISFAVIGELKAQFAGLEATDAASFKVVKESESKVRKLLSVIEARRKELKAPHLEYNTLVESEAKTFKELLKEVMDPLTVKRRAWEDEQARIKNEAAAKKVLYSTWARKRIDEIRGAPLAFMGKSAAEIEAEFERLCALNTTEDEWGEFQQDALAACQMSISQLKQMGEQARELEALREQQAVTQDAADPAILITPENGNEQADSVAEAGEIMDQQDIPSENRQFEPMTLVSGTSEEPAPPATYEELFGADIKNFEQFLANIGRRVTAAIPGVNTEDAEHIVGDFEEKFAALVIETQEICKTVTGEQE